MIEMGTKEVALKKLVSEEGFSTRMLAPRVVKLVQEIQAGKSNPQAPTVRLTETPGQYEVVYGEDTVAAWHMLGRPGIRCNVIECSQLEFELARQAEDAHNEVRSKTYASLVKALLDINEEQVTAEMQRGEFEPNKGKAGQGGRPMTARGEARNRLARCLGTTVDALRLAERRLEKGQLSDTRSQPPPKPGKPEWRLETYGVDAYPAIVERAAEVRRALEKACNQLSAAKTSLHSLLGLESELPISQYSALHNAASQVSSQARALLPSHLCPFCKGVPVVRVKCAACWGTGWVTEQAFRSAPEELQTPRFVMFAGELLDMRTMKPPARIQEIDVPAAVFAEDSYEDDSEPPEDYVQESVDLAESAEVALDEALRNVDDQPYAEQEWDI